MRRSGRVASAGPPEDLRHSGARYQGADAALAGDARASCKRIAISTHRISQKLKKRRGGAKIARDGGGARVGKEIDSLLSGDGYLGPWQYSTRIHRQERRQRLGIGPTTFGESSCGRPTPPLARASHQAELLALDRTPRPHVKPIIARSARCASVRSARSRPPLATATHYAGRRKNRHIARSAWRSAFQSPQRTGHL